MSCCRQRVTKIRKKRGGCPFCRIHKVFCLRLLPGPIYLASASPQHFMRKRPNPDSEANIKRIDTKPRAAKQTHGFQVHFLRGQEMVTKMFSDAVHGGKEAARRAARKFKRITIADLPDRTHRTSSKRTKTARKTAPKRRSASAKKKTRRR